jgi:hypothetical protein
MISLNSVDSFEIKGQGKAYVFETDAYTVSDMYLLRKRKRTILIDGDQYKIIGIEHFMGGDWRNHTKFSLLVKPV